jgi:hypothetical protein
MLSVKSPCRVTFAWAIKAEQSRTSVKEMNANDFFIMAEVQLT